MFTDTAEDFVHLQMFQLNCYIHLILQKTGTLGTYFFCCSKPIQVFNSAVIGNSG